MPLVYQMKLVLLLGILSVRAECGEPGVIHYPDELPSACEVLYGDLHIVKGRAHYNVQLKEVRGRLIVSAFAETTLAHRLKVTELIIRGSFFVAAVYAKVDAEMLTLIDVDQDILKFDMEPSTIVMNRMASHHLKGITGKNLKRLVHEGTLSAYSFPAATNLTEIRVVGGRADMTTLLPALKEAGSVEIRGVDLDSIGLDVLRIRDSLTLVDNVYATAIHLPKLKSVGGEILVRGNLALRSFSAPLLKEARLILPDPLESVDIPATIRWKGISTFNSAAFCSQLALPLATKGLAFTVINKRQCGKHCVHNAPITAANLQDVMACTEIAGSLTLDASSPDVALPNLLTLHGNLTFVNYSNRFSAGLREVTGKLSMENIPQAQLKSLAKTSVLALRGITFDPGFHRLQVTRSLQVHNTSTTKLTGIFARNLDDISFQDCPSLITATISGLSSVKDLALVGNISKALRLADQPFTVTNNFTIRNNPHTNLTCPILKVLGHLVLQDNMALTSVEFPELTGHTPHLVNLNNPRLKSVHFPGLNTEYAMIGREEKSLPNEHPVPEENHPLYTPNPANQSNSDQEEANSVHAGLKIYIFGFLPICVLLFILMVVMIR